MRGEDEWAGALLERWLCVCCISCDQCRKYERYEPVGGSGGAISSCGGVPADLTAEGTLSVIYCEETDILKRCGSILRRQTCPRCLRSRLQSGMRRVMYSRSCWGVCLHGEAFREAMGWNSACFTITQMGENVRIVTRDWDTGTA